MKQYFILLDALLGWNRERVDLRNDFTEKDLRQGNSARLIRIPICVHLFNSHLSRETSASSASCQDLCSPASTSLMEATRSWKD